MRDSVGAGFDQSVPDGPRIGEQAVGASNDVEVGTQPVFAGPVDPIFDPGPPRAPKKGQVFAKVDTDSTVQMISTAVGLSPFPRQLCKETDCWNCTLQLSEDQKRKQCAQFTKNDKMILAINLVHANKNNKTEKVSQDNSPLVLWTKTCLFLHCCLWLGGKLCTRCTEGVFNNLFQNFTRIIDSMVSKVKNAPVHESARSSVEELFFAQWGALKALNTGHDSLGCGVISKSGSAKFIFYFIRFLVNGKWDDDYPSNARILTIKTSADNKVVKDAQKKEMKEKKTESHEKNMLTATLGRKEHEDDMALNKRRKLDLATASKPQRTNKSSQEMNTRYKALDKVGLFDRGSGSRDVSAEQLEADMEHEK